MYDADTEIKQSKSRDLAWIICRLQNTDNQVVPSWSGFNHLVTKSNNPKTVAGMIPIINSPAHDYDTLWTVFTELPQNDYKTGPKVYNHNL